MGLIPGYLNSKINTYIDMEARKGPYVHRRQSSFRESFPAWTRVIV